MRTEGENVYRGYNEDLRLAKKQGNIPR